MQEYFSWASAGEITIAELGAGVISVLTAPEALALIALCGAGLTTLAALGAYYNCERFG
jgi:hypothetical protein